MSIQNGGPAFPVPAGNFSGSESWTSTPGMDLRDYFAGQALAGLLSRSDVGVPHCRGCAVPGDDAGEHYADISYRYADAMLHARGGRDGT